MGQVIFLKPYEILSESKLMEYVHRINRHKPAAITAFAGTVFEIARHAKRKGLRPHRPRFSLSSVEMLCPMMRETIEEVFGCPVHDMYGAAESGRVAAQCSDGKWNILSFHNHVEVVAEDGAPTKP